MAFANYTRATDTGLSLEISAVVHTLMTRAVDYRAYRKTLAELRALDNRTLADLGLHRSGLRAEAIRAVYGTRG
jgi:uncharacterized protein YjiS (DUF1127 family)